jgi:hypothetical protein
VARSGAASVAANLTIGGRLHRPKPLPARPCGRRRPAVGACTGGPQPSSGGGAASAGGASPPAVRIRGPTRGGKGPRCPARRGRQAGRAADRRVWRWAPCRPVTGPLPARAAPGDLPWRCLASSRDERAACCHGGDPASYVAGELPDDRARGHSRGRTGDREPRRRHPRAGHGRRARAACPARRRGCAGNGDGDARR